MISDTSELIPAFDIDHVETVNCSNSSIVHCLLSDFGQALFMRSCHEDVSLARKSHNWAGTAFVQEDPAGGSKLTEQT